MTNEHLDWEPSNPCFADQEDAMTDCKGELEVHNRAPHLVINSVSFMNEDHSDVTDYDNFGNVLEAYVNVSSDNCSQVGIIHDIIRGGGTITSCSGKEVSPDELAKHWNILLDRAKRTVTMLTQRGVVLESLLK